MCSGRDFDALLVRIGAFSLVALFLLNITIFAQARGGKKARPSPNAAVSQTIGTTEVSINYGRPGLKGRELRDNRYVVAYALGGISRYMMGMMKRIMLPIP